MPSIVKNSYKRSPEPIRMRLNSGVPVIDDTYEWIVKADTVGQNKLDILATAGIPRIGVTVAPRGVGLCTGLSATHWVKNPLYWTVKADFSTEVQQGQDNPDPNTDPLIWIPVYQQKRHRYQEIVTKDRNGDTIANSAGQPFENGMTTARYLPVWEFYQFEASTVTDEQMIDRNESVNSVVFKGRAAKSLLLTVEDSIVGYYYGQLQRYNLYRLVYNKKLWTHKRQDIGTIYLDGGVAKAYLVDGKPVAGALDGAGAKQPDGTPPAVLDFDQYDETPFGAFLRT